MTILQSSSPSSGAVFGAAIATSNHTVLIGEPGADGGGRVFQFELGPTASPTPLPTGSPHGPTLDPTPAPFAPPTTRPTTAPSPLSTFSPVSATTTSPSAPPTLAAGIDVETAALIGSMSGLFVLLAAAAILYLRSKKRPVPIVDSSPPGALDPRARPRRLKYARRVYDGSNSNLAVAEVVDDYEL